MRELRLVTMSDDGATLVLAGDRGEQFRLPITEALRAAARGDRARLGQLEIALESQLTPKEIQTRIRHGESAEEVARVAGVPLDRVRRFEGPVLAERAHVADRARGGALRRGDAARRADPGGGPAPLLDDAVTAALSARGVDPETLRWDAWRREDGRWTVEVTYATDSNDERARFTYDTTARASVPADDAGRRLAGEEPVAEPAPARVANVVRLEPVPSRVHDAASVPAEVSSARLPGSPRQPQPQRAGGRSRPAGTGGRDTGARPPAFYDTEGDDPEGIDTRVGDTRVADTRVGDTRIGDTRVGDPPGGDTRVDDPPVEDATGATEDNPARARPPARHAAAGGRGRRASVPSWDEIVFGRKRD